MIYVKNEPSFFAGENKQPRTAEGRLASFSKTANLEYPKMQPQNKRPLTVQKPK